MMDVEEGEMISKIRKSEFHYIHEGAIIFNFCHFSFRFLPAKIYFRYTPVLE